MSDIFDFGFTTVDPEDVAPKDKLDSANEEILKLNEYIKSLKVQIEQRETVTKKLYTAITPLLNNLKKNPSKEYLYWPNRLTKVQEFSKKLEDIYKSNSV